MRHRSLSALGNVIQALVTKQAHVPFRDSKLTYLLQDSLGKDNKTLMIVQVNPMLSSRSESVCSLNFAARVQKVELGKARSHADSDELVKTRAMVRMSTAFWHAFHAVTRLHNLQLTKARDEMKALQDEQTRNVEALQHSLEAERLAHAVMIKQFE